MLKLFSQIALLPLDLLPLFVLPCLSPLLLSLHDHSVICYSFHLLTLDAVLFSTALSLLFLFTVYCSTETYIFPKNFKDEVNRACWSCVLEGKTCQCTHYATFILWSVGEVCLQDSFLKVVQWSHVFLWHKAEQNKTVLLFTDDKKSFFLMVLVPTVSCWTRPDVSKFTGTGSGFIAI